MPGDLSIEKSGKQSNKAKKKPEEKIKAELELFIHRLMKCKLKPDTTTAPVAKTTSSNKDAAATPPTIPQLDSKLDMKEMREICLRAREQFMLEPVLLRLQPPICIFGDLHGQFLDLQKMMEKLGPPPKQKYLFLGDYVDRGFFSLETVTMLLAMKVRYPKHLYMIRGNHETRAVNKVYGFLDECKRRFPDDKKNELWTLYQHVFNCMPMSALIADKIFCTHGGISEDLISWKQFDRITRPTDITDVGLLTDLVWADPINDKKKYEPSVRGISQVFGLIAIEDFCNNLGVELIVRGHQAVNPGWELTDDKRCLTIFSAPLYCGEQDNLAAMLAVSKHLECSIYTFKGVNAAVATTSVEVKDKEDPPTAVGTTPKTPIAGTPPKEGAKRDSDKDKKKKPT